MTVKFYLDVDDTLLHWTEGFLNFCGLKGVPYKKDDLLFGIEFEKFDALVRDFNATHHFSNLDLNKEVLDKYLFTINDNIDLMTCCGNHDDTQKHRLDNLDKVFYYYPTTVHFLDFFDKKSDYIRQIKSKDEKPVLIDDSQSQVLSFYEEFKEEMKDRNSAVVWLKDHRYHKIYKDWLKKKKQIKQIPEILIIDQDTSCCYINQSIKQAKEFMGVK